MESLKNLLKDKDIDYINYIVSVNDNVILYVTTELFTIDFYDDSISIEDNENCFYIPTDMEVIDSTTDQSGKVFYYLRRDNLVIKLCLKLDE